MQRAGVRASFWVVVRCLQHFPRAAGSELRPLQNSLTNREIINQFLKSRKFSRANPVPPAGGQRAGVRTSPRVVVRGLQHLRRAAGSDLFLPQNSLTNREIINQFLKSRKCSRGNSVPPAGVQGPGVRASSWLVVRCLHHLPRAAGSDLSPPQNSLTSFKKSKIFPRDFGSAGRGARSRGKGKLLAGGPVSAAPSAGSRQRI